MRLRSIRTRVIPTSPCLTLRSARAVAPVLLFALTLSCAAPAELARRSEAALAAGKAQQAWDWAERAMRADPDLPRARNAMTAAALESAPDWQARIRNLAEADTIAAAKLSLEFTELRARLGAWGIAVPLDSTFLDAQSVIRAAAANRLYEQGVEMQRGGRPREAYRAFTAVSEIAPGFRDSGERAYRSFELGVSRIAVVPFDDDTGVPGLAGELATWMHGQLATNMPPKKYPFVRFVPNLEVAARARAESRMTREAAIRVGRSLGASRVVWGRLHGLNSDTRTESWHDRVFRKVTERDSASRSRVRYDELDVETVSRERAVRVAWEFEVIETDEEEALASRSGTDEVVARAIYTSFNPAGDSDDYVLAPPEWRSDRAAAWKSAHDDWKRRFGDWSVSDFLEASVGARSRGGYRRGDREAYLRTSKPFVSEDLPPAGDLAYLALRELTSPAWEMLRSLEREPGP